MDASKNSILSKHSSNNSSCQDITVLVASDKPDKKKRIRPYKRRHDVSLVMPRILKSDIRKQYSTMFTNVFNIQDYNLLTGCFETFCHPNFELYQNSADTLSEPDKLMYPNAPKILELSGVKLGVQFVYTRLLTMPDVVFRLQNSTFKVFKDGSNRSQVDVSFVVNGTMTHDLFCEKKVYARCDAEITEEDAIDIEEQSELYKQYATDLNYDTQIGTQETLSVYSADSFQEIVRNAPLLETPIALSMAGTYVMHLDAEKRVTRIEITMSDFSESKVVDL